MSNSQLDLSKAESIAAETLGYLTDDFLPEELIPGLILAVQLLAEEMDDPLGVLTEADELLVNGFPEDEVS